jgi:hypothetical protein
MEETKEHLLAKEAVENLRNKTSNDKKIKTYFQFLGINPENLDLDQVAENIKNVNRR